MGKKRRTKKEKIIARLRRQVKSTVKYEAKNAQDTERAKTAKRLKQKSKAKKQEIFDYNPTLIQKDLRKTLFFSIFFTAIIIALWFWQKTGWWLPKM